MLREYAGVLAEFSQVLDLGLLGLGFYAAVELYRYKHVIVGSVWEQYFLIFLVYLLSWLLCSNGFGVYQSRRFMSAMRETTQLIKSHLLSFGITLTSVTLYESKLIHNRFIFYFGFGALSLTLVVHLTIRLVLQLWRAMGKNSRYVLIIGSGVAARTYLDKVNRNPQLGNKVIGYLAVERNHLQVPYLGDYAKLEEVIGTQIVDVAIVTAPVTDHEVKKCVEMLDAMGKTVAVLLDDTVAKVARSRPIDFDGLPMFAYDVSPRRPWDEIAKRTLDVLCTGIGLILLSPVLLAIAIAVKLSSKGPVIFAQERVGLNGRTFKMYKFRSMVVNAEELKAKLVHLNEMNGPVFKIKDDPRITEVGGFLRKTSLDELPQLWNVFKGDMSLVGPRPPLPSEVDLYDPRHRKRLAVKPGITCIWQISGRNEVDFEEWMEMDAEYVEQWSFWLDMEILARTVPVVLVRKGAS